MQNKNKPSARPKQAATGDYSQLYPRQQQAIDKLSDWYFSNELECTLEGYAGTGKALLNGTPVLTNKGWTSIESLKIGDLVATPYEGFQKVKGVYPQGKRPLYEIIFSVDELLYVMRIIYGKFVLKECCKIIIE